MFSQKGGLLTKSHGFCVASEGHEGQQWSRTGVEHTWWGGGHPTEHSGRILGTWRGISTGLNQLRRDYLKLLVMSSKLRGKWSQAGTHHQQTNLREPSSSFKPFSGINIFKPWCLKVFLLTVAPSCWASCTAASTRSLSASLGRVTHFILAIRNLRWATTLSTTLSCTHNTQKTCGQRGGESRQTGSGMCRWNKSYLVAL